MEMIPVSSGNIAAIGYDPTTRELDVEFNSGGLYAYSGVPAEIWDAFQGASSLGQYHAQNIKGVYPYTRLS